MSEKHPGFAQQQNTALGAQAAPLNFRSPLDSSNLEPRRTYSSSGDKALNSQCYPLEAAQPNTRFSSPLGNSSEGEPRSLEAKVEGVGTGSAVFARMKDVGKRVANRLGLGGRNPSSNDTASAQPLVGIIDTGFGANSHGAEMQKTISNLNPQAAIWQGDGVGKGRWANSLNEFVEVAEASGRRAIANLSFDLTQVNPDGSTSTRYQLTADEQGALATAEKAGIPVFVSIGNEASHKTAWEQADRQFDNLVVIGGAEGRDRAATSSYGNRLDLLAPNRLSGHSVEGTSLATAYATGVASKVWAANSALSDRQLEQVLKSSASDLKTPGRDAETGFGLLNPAAAIQRAKQMDIPLANPADNSKQYEVWRGEQGVVASERANGSVTDWFKDAADTVEEVASDVIHETKELASDIATFVNKKIVKPSPRYIQPVVDDREPRNDEYRETSEIDIGLSNGLSDASANRVNRRSEVSAGSTLKYEPGTSTMTGERVRQWQSAMRNLGYDIEVDGKYGPQSEAVARQFQQDNGLEVDGKVGPQTWAGSFPQPENPRQASAGSTLKYEPGTSTMTGERVRQWQSAIRNQGYDIEVDGKYGPQSEAVARQFQEDNGLKVDGFVGPETWAATFDTNPEPAPLKPHEIPPQIPEGSSRREMGIARRKLTSNSLPSAPALAEPNESGNWWNRFVDTTKNTASEAGKFLGDASESLSNFAGDAYETVSNTANRAWDSAGNTFDLSSDSLGSVNNYLSDAASTVVENFDNAVDDAREFTGDVANTVVETFDNTVDNTRESASDALDSAGDFVNDVADNVGDGLSSAGNFVSEAAEQTWDSIDAIGDSVSNGLETADNWVERNGSIVSEVGHTVLDVAGFVPVLGAVADLINAGWYLAEGREAEAALSALGAIPLAGDAAAVTRLAVRYGDDVIQSIDNFLVDVGRAQDIASIPQGIIGTTQGLSDAVEQFSQGNYVQGSLSGTNGVLSGVLSALGVRSGVDTARSHLLPATGIDGLPFPNQPSAFSRLSSSSRSLSSVASDRDRPSSLEQSDRFNNTPEPASVSSETPSVTSSSSRTFELDSSPVLESSSKPEIAASSSKPESNILGRPLGAREEPVPLKRPNQFGTHKGVASGRDYYPDNIGVPLSDLSTAHLQIKSNGVNRAEQHLSRFGPDPQNQEQIQRLRDIAAGRLEPTEADLNFYAHELRESVHYRRLGYENRSTGEVWQPRDSNEAYDMWNNAHTAALEDYGQTDNELSRPKS